MSHNVKPRHYHDRGLHQATVVPWQSHLLIISAPDHCGWQSLPDQNITIPLGASDDGNARGKLKSKGNPKDIDIQKGSVQNMEHGGTYSMFDGDSNNKEGDVDDDDRVMIVAEEERSVDDGALSL